MQRGGIVFTQTMREEYELLRRRELRRLAGKVLRTVGVRQLDGRKVLLCSDVARHERSIVNMGGPLRAFTTGEERHAVYQANTRLAEAIVKILLRLAGHSVAEIVVDVDGKPHRALELT